MSITNRIVNNALLTLNKYAILLVVICFAPFALFSLFLNSVKYIMCIFLTCTIGYNLKSPVHYKILF